MRSIIDVHVHDPDIFNVNKHQPKEVAKKILLEMDEIGIEKIFLFAFEVDPMKSYELIMEKDIYRGIEEIISAGIYFLPKNLLDYLEDSMKAKLEHSSSIKTAYTPTERVSKIARYSNGRILAVGSIMLSDSINEIISRLESFLRLNIIGIKIYPTLQFINPSDNKFYAVYSFLEDHKLALFIHTGCDPGLWELPKFCASADPKNAEDIAKNFKELKIILCHMGAYSAFKPGIFLENAIQLVNKYDNIYVDTAAVEPDIVEYAVRKMNIEKIFFGSDYPVLGVSWRYLVNNMKLLDIPNNVREKILYLNAKTIFNL